MSRYGAERWPDDIEIERPEWVERFHALMRSPDAKAKHEAYLKELGVREEEVLPPAIPGTDCFNPVLEKFWLPFAR